MTPSNLTPTANAFTIIAQALIGLGILVYMITKCLQPWLAKRGFGARLRREVAKEASIQTSMNATLSQLIAKGTKAARIQAFVLHNGSQNVLGQCEMCFSCLFEVCKGGVLPEKGSLRRLQTADHAWFIRELCLNAHSITANKLEEIKQRQNKYDSTFGLLARQGIKSMACVPMYRGTEIMGYVTAQFEDENQVDDCVIQALCILSGRLGDMIFNGRQGRPKPPDEPTDQDLIAQLQL